MADAIQYVTPSAGATVAVNAGMGTLVIDTGLLATLTVALPAGPIDGQRVSIASGGGVTLLTVNGGTINGLITTLAANGFARYIYSTAAAKWFRSG